MAEKKPEGDEAEQPPPKKKNKLVLIIVGAVVAVALVGGGAAFFLMKKGGHKCNPEEEGCEEAVAEENADAPKKAKKDHNAEAPPVFVKLDPFTVRLSSDGQEAYLQAVPELRVLDAEVGEKIKVYMPEIRHKTLLILAAKKASDLATPQGVQTLSNEMRATINNILEPPNPRAKKLKKKGAEETAGAASDRAGPDEPVQAVLFTSFIVQ